MYNDIDDINDDMMILSACILQPFVEHFLDQLKFE